MNLVIASVQSLRDLWDSEIDGTKESISYKRVFAHFFWHHFDKKRLTPLCSFGCSTWSCIQRQVSNLKMVWKSSAQHTKCISSILRRQVSSQMLKQFGYGETNAVMVRGPCDLTRSCWDLDYLAVRFQVRHVVLVMCFFFWKCSTGKHCLAVASCAGLIDAVHAVVLASTYMAVSAFDSPKLECSRIPMESFSLARLVSPTEQLLSLLMTMLPGYTWGQ